MTRTSSKEGSFVSFLDVMLEAGTDKPKKEKKKKVKASTPDLDAPEQPVDIPSDEIRYVEPFNSPRFTPSKKTNVDLEKAGFGQPLYTPPAKKAEETPADVLNKLKASKESGELNPDDYEVLKNKVVATTHPKVSRKGLPTTQGGSALAREKVKPTKLKYSNIVADDEPDDLDDINMDDYAGSKERIPDATGIGPSSNDSDAAGYTSIASSLGSEKLKIGDNSFMTSDKEGYEEWQPSYRAGEWSEDDLPIKGYIDTLKSVSGVKGESDYANEKLMLAQETPKFVLQGMAKAASDYKELIRPRLEVIKKAAQEYVKYLKLIDKHIAIPVAGSDFTADELSELDSPQALASLVGLKKRGEKDPTADFMSFFKEWIYEGNKQLNSKASAADKKKLGVDQKQIFEDTPAGPVPSSMLLKSAFEIIRRLGIIDLDDDEPATRSTAEMLHLKTKFEPEISRVEQFLIVRKRADRPDPSDPSGKKTIKGDMAAGDPGFRYFFGEVQAGEGGQRYYWDWIRRAAKKAGKYPENAPWALKSKMISNNEKDK